MEQINVVIVGHTGAGKSTLIKRLLGETNFTSKEVLPENPKGLEGCLSSIISTQFGERNYSFIEFSNQKEFLTDIAKGAVAVNAAILVIDASKKLRDQVCHYAYLLSMFGIKQTIVIVNKMDIKRYNRINFWQMSEEVAELLEKLKIHIIDIIPASAEYGDNINTKSPQMDWNTSDNIKKSLDYFTAPENFAQHPLRLIVQSTFLSDQGAKILAKITSGKLFHDHKLTFGPIHQTAKVISIEVDNHQRISASSGESIALVLEDIDYIERGQVGFNICHPPLTADFLNVEVFWIDDKSLQLADKVDILCGTNCRSGQVEKITKIRNPAFLEAKFNHVDQLAESQVANVRIKLDYPICIDLFETLPYLGMCTIFLDGKISGGGILE